MKRRNGVLAQATAAAALLGLGVGLPTHASELVYQPINPSFGGSPLNSSHLLGLADRQNQHKDDGYIGGTTGISRLSQGEQFANQLTSLMFSALAQNVTEAMFGEDPQLTGQIVFGSQTINWVNEGDSITLTILDTATGSTTEIVVPNLSFAP